MLIVKKVLVRLRGDYAVYMPDGLIIIDFFLSIHLIPLFYLYKNVNIYQKKKHFMQTVFILSVILI